MAAPAANGVALGLRRSLKRARADRGGGASSGRPVFSQRDLDDERAKWRAELESARAGMEARLKALDAEKSRMMRLLAEDNQRLRKQMGAASAVTAERDRLAHESRTIKKACVLLNARNGAQVAEIDRLNKIVAKLQQANYTLRAHLQQAHPAGGGNGVPGRYIC